MTNDQRFKVGDTVYFVEIDEAIKVTMGSFEVKKVEYIPIGYDYGRSEKGKTALIITKWRTVYYSNSQAYLGRDLYKEENPALFGSSKEAFEFLENFMKNPWKNTTFTEPETN